MDSKVCISHPVLQQRKKKRTFKVSESVIQGMGPVPVEVLLK